jgi:adenylate cyclase
MERRLTAIFAADVAGYSRLIGADEEGTLTRLTAHRRELIEPKIAEHQGRLVKTGDGVLAEFASPVKAVRCAIDVQHGMATRNADIPEGQRIEFRIGINPTSPEWSSSIRVLRRTALGTEVSFRALPLAGG